MKAFASAACVMLCTAATAHAGAVLEVDLLTPPNVPGGYLPGTVVDFGVSISTDLGQPAQIRGLTLDFGASDPSLTFLDPHGCWGWPPCTPVFVFDFSSILADFAYARFPVYPRPNMTHTLLEPIPGFVLTIPADDPLFLGTGQVLLPAMLAEYTLDALNPTGASGGAMLSFGFPESTTWTAGGGEITGDPVVITMVPDPATVGLLAMGAVVCTRRQRRSSGYR